MITFFIGRFWAILRYLASGMRILGAAHSVSAEDRE
jgi:hypothetical protein